MGSILNIEKIKMRYFRKIVAVCMIGAIVGCGGNRRGGVKPFVNSESHGKKINRGGVVGYVEGEKIYFDDLRDQLIEAGGGEIFVEVVLDRLIENELKMKNLEVTDQDIQWERDLMMTGIDGDRHHAARLFEEFQQRRGVGEVRLVNTLKRNAGLRKLVAGSVKLNDATIKERFELLYGQKKVLRMILREELKGIKSVLKRLEDGENFIDLAVQLSEDTPSAERGGLLSAISVQDKSYPLAVRDVAKRIKVGELSGVIALDGKYAVFHCEEILPAKKIDFNSVKAEVEKNVRREIEAMKMQILVKGLIQDAEVMVFDGGVKSGWDYQMKLMKQK